MNANSEEALSVLAKIACSSKAYYQLLNDGPQPEHFAEFLNRLPDGLQSYYRQKGYEGSKKSILFRRFVLEQEGRRMDTFLKERLNISEFKLWEEQDIYQTELFFKLK